MAGWQIAVVGCLPLWRGCCCASCLYQRVKVRRNAPKRRSRPQKFKPGAFWLDTKLLDLTAGTYVSGPSKLAVAAPAWSHVISRSENPLTRSLIRTPQRARLTLNIWPTYITPIAQATRWKVKKLINDRTGRLCHYVSCGQRSFQWRSIPQVVYTKRRCCCWLCYCQNKWNKANRYGNILIFVHTEALVRAAPGRWTFPPGLLTWRALV